MLILSLVLATPLIAFAHLTATSRGFWWILAASAFTVYGLLVVFGPLSVGLFISLPLVILFVTLGLILLSQAQPRSVGRTFLLFWVGAPLIAYAFPCLFAVPDAIKVYTETPPAVAPSPPVAQSLEDRLPERVGDVRTKPMTDDTSRRLTDLEEWIEREGHAGGPTPPVRRREKLASIHMRAVDAFVNSQGFGIRRVVREEDPELADAILALNQSYEFERYTQPGTRPTTEWDPERAEPLSLNEETDLHRLHEGGVVDFVNAPGFGEFRGRRAVVGFRPHRVSRMPDPAGHWHVQTLDLVSLLLHDKPGVYVTDRLPAMAAIREVPTRPLDAFEASGLAVLKDGEDLFVGKTGGDLRLLGAIRSIRQCVNCHGGERGDLLGAFSYTFRRE